MTLTDTQPPAEEDDKTVQSRAYETARADWLRWQKAYDESLAGLEKARDRYKAKRKMYRALLSRPELAEMDAREKATGS